MRKVNFFPKKQDTCLIYTEELCETELFNHLYIQTSAKNSVFFRILRSKPVLSLRSLFKTAIDTPDSSKEYLGIQKPDKVILFEMYEGKPVAVWRKDENSSWESSAYLGNPLLSAYTVEEFESKKKKIQRALQFHWDSITKDLSQIHGDLTHFNILVNEKEAVSFIDQKSSDHSKLFDFFYFYAYLKQCLDRCRTLSGADNRSITKELKSMIRSICTYDSQRELEADLSSMNVPTVNGIRDLEGSIEDFKSIFV